MNDREVLLTVTLKLTELKKIQKN